MQETAYDKRRSLQIPQTDFKPQPACLLGASNFSASINEPFVLACRKDHPLARRRKVTWAELNDHDYLTVTRASGNRAILEQALAGAAAPPRWFCEVRHVLSVVSLVEAGPGVAAVPRLAMPPGDHPLLASVPLVEPAVARTIGLIRLRARRLAPAAQQLHDMIRALRQKRGQRTAKTIDAARKHKV